VNSGNIQDILKNKEISGVLVGGASLDTKEFKNIIKIAKSISEK